MNGFEIWVQAPLRNLFLLCFGASTIQKKAFSNQNKGHLGSRYIYTYLQLVFLIQLFNQNILNIRYMYNDTLPGEDDVVGRWHNIWEALREMNLRSIEGRMSRCHHGCA